ncbi:PREDICTED: charged multivesicular body protein 2b [Nicrophorus vespilloides]|uniref:Charged multivesicular body protein 2b n=1 Tax=Nicrophorus vespilloides TaxID=110193 RepID=A0ABM1MD19_NICVS|nr:PREDICTED: charged multivesicular body protein 2b [Nicrophorus vespilloides]
MFNLFSKPDPKEQQRKADRALKKAGRDIERDRRELEREEKKLELEIKKLAREGNNEGCKVLAKQLILLRKQKMRTYTANSKIQSIGIQNKTMGANAKLAGAMAVAGSTMADMNRSMRPEQIAAMTNAFSREAAKLDMSEEMMNDAFDDILADSDEEQESDNVISKVLDEIGIEMSGKMAGVPLPEKGAIGGSMKTTLTDEDIEKQLAQLRA